MAGRVTSKPTRKAMISIFPCLGTNVQLRIQSLCDERVPRTVGDAGQWSKHEWPHKNDLRVKLDRDDLLKQFANWGDWFVVDSNNKEIKRLTEDERTSLEQQSKTQLERQRYEYENRSFGTKIREVWRGLMGAPLDTTHRRFNDYVEEE